MMPLMESMAARRAERPPNIVLILADDLGITDIGACERYSNKIGADDPFLSEEVQKRCQAINNGKTVHSSRAGRRISSPFSLPACSQSGFSATAELIHQALG